MNDLERARLERLEGNKTVTPTQLLEWALDDLKRGKVKANKAMVILVEDTTEAFDVHPYRANLTRLEEAGLLSVRFWNHMRNWTGADDE